jgi:asparagine synthase (glutamine-hydrolysing)
VEERIAEGAVSTEVFDHLQAALPRASGMAHRHYMSSHIRRWLTARSVEAYVNPAYFRDVVDPIDALAAELPPSFRRWSPLARAQWLELTTLLPGYLLATQGDRCFMAHSVESRFPFLDTEVVDLACRLPDSLKIDASGDKLALRRIAAGLLPPAIAARPKQGYQAPVAAVLKSIPGRELVDAFLSPDAIHGYGIFVPERVDQLVSALLKSAPVSEASSVALAAILTTQLCVSSVERMRCESH